MRCDNARGSYIAQYVGSAMHGESAAILIGIAAIAYAVPSPEDSHPLVRSARDRLARLVDDRRQDMFGRVVVRPEFDNPVSTAVIRYRLEMLDRAARDVSGVVFGE